MNVSLFTRTVGILALCALHIPLLCVLVSSVIPSVMAPGRSDIYWYSGYANLVNDRSFWGPAWRSAWIAIASSGISTALGTLAALAMHRGKFRGKLFFEGLFLMPLVFPEIVFGIMILVWFLILRLTLGHISILLAHVTFSVSYALLAVRARLNNFDEALLEAARDLGATTTQAFWRVTVPLLLPGIISAFFMSFAMSFDDFLITFFVSGVGTDTLPVKLYSMIKFGIKPAAYALSAAVLVLTVVIMIFAVRLSQWTSDAK